MREHPERGMDWLPVGAPADGHAVFGPDKLDDVIAESDYVLLAAPLTSATRSLISAPRLALMKSSSCLINVARGALVEETALAEALRERRIAGAEYRVAPDVAPELLSEGVLHVDGREDAESLGLERVHRARHRDVERGVERDAESVARLIDHDSIPGPQPTNVGRGP